MRKGLWSLLCAVVSAVTISIVGAASALASEASCPNEAFRTGPSAGLPDCRAYEQVSPANKAGYDAVPRGTLAPAWASPNGDGIAYLDYGAFPGAAGNNALLAAHLSNRGTSGWQTTELTPEKPQAAPFESYIVGYDFTEDLTHEITKVPLQPLTSDATPGVYNLFLRHPDGSYSWINAAKPPLTPAEVAVLEGDEPEVTSFVNYDEVAFAGASRDLRHIIFESNAALTPEAPTALLTESLYESVEGKVRLVGILPDDTPAAEGATAGSGSESYYVSGSPNADGRVEHAISEDGERVIFTAHADGGEPVPAQSGMEEVYVRIAGKETVEASAPDPGATPEMTNAEPGRFWAASADGSRVFFTTKAQLTTEANTGKDKYEALYEYNVDSKTVRDLTPDANPVDAATGPRVLGVVGASSNGEYVYFVATGQLVEGEGVHNRPNLYMVRNGGTPVFIATLNNSTDKHVWDKETHPAELEAYITPDGRHMAFMSTMSLPTNRFPSGYDNTIAATGAPASEVFEYSASTPEEEALGKDGSLACASCDPSGAQPVGDAFIGGIDEKEGHIGSSSTPFHHVRSVSDNGKRVFFTAPPQTNAGTPYTKVYEYEWDGAGSCETTGGCTFLISSPYGDEVATFLDASSEGEDIFFGTDSQLVPADTGNLVDVYDARVDGGATASSTGHCRSQCRALGQGVPPGPPLLSATSGPSGNVAASPQKVRTTKQHNATSPKKHRGCRANAKRIKKRKARERALKVCTRAESGRHKHKHRHGRGTRQMKPRHAGIRRGRSGTRRAS